MVSIVNPDEKEDKNQTQNKDKKEDFPPPNPPDTTNFKANGGKEKENKSGNE